MRGVSKMIWRKKWGAKEFTCKMEIKVSIPSILLYYTITMSVNHNCNKIYNQMRLFEDHFYRSLLLHELCCVVCAGANNNKGDRTELTLCRLNGMTHLISKMINNVSFVLNLKEGKRRRRRVRDLFLHSSSSSQ